MTTRGADASAGRLRPADRRRQRAGARGPRARHGRCRDGAVEPALSCLRRCRSPARRLHALRAGASAMDRELPSAGHPVSRRDDAARSARATRQIPERVLPRAGARWINEDGRWVPAAINFTSEAKPDQVGSGIRAINTLFHEGGHAAHFANVVQNSPCFSQEYPPTSMAYAETQSMFCDQPADRSPTGWCATPRRRTARRSRTRSSSTGSPAVSRCAPSMPARLPSSPTSSRRCIGCLTPT